MTNNLLIMATLQPVNVFHVSAPQFGNFRVTGRKERVDESSIFGTRASVKYCLCRPLLYKHGQGTFLTTGLHGVDFGMVDLSCRANLSKFKSSSHAINGPVKRDGNTLSAFHCKMQLCANNVHVSYCGIS